MGQKKCSQWPGCECAARAHCPHDSKAELTTTKADFFDKLNSGQLYSFPETDLEMEWFDEWLEKTPEGKKHRTNSDKAVNQIHANGFFQLFFLKAFFRDQIDAGVTEFRIKLVNERELEILPHALSKPYKEKYSSHFIKL